MSKSKYSRDFVTKQFNRFYQDNWIGKGKTASDFVDTIREVMPHAHCDYKYVSKWKTGVMSPVKYLPAICKVLGVSTADFVPKTHDDRYQYATDFADGLEGRLEEIAVENFKIDLTFLQGLRNIIPDFDDLFPQFLPLVFYGPFDKTHKVYERMSAGETSETSQQGVLQIKKDNKTYFLSPYDLKIISLMQRKMVEHTKKWFEYFRNQFNTAEAEANLKYEDLFSLDPLSDEELQSIDRYGMYTEEEWKKYHLPITKGTRLFTEEDDSTEDE